VYLFGLAGANFYQGHLQFILVFGVIFLVSKLVAKFFKNSLDIIFLTFAFGFSSAFLGLALRPSSWFFSQVIATFLLTLFLYEFLDKKRYWFLGIISALLFLTRITTALVVFVPLLDLLFGQESLRRRFIKALMLLFLLSLGIGAQGFYNYVRFGSFLEQGYSMQIIPPLQSSMRNYGLFSLVHLPGNLYYFLLSTPLPVFRDNISHVLKFPYIQANPWGMSIFVTSPYFVYLFFLKYKDKLSKILIATSILIAIPLFLYYGVGYRQFGYRYSLDFLPLLFVLFIKNLRKKHKRIPLAMKYVIVVSSIVNLYLIATLYYF
jgi:hypothetical protein